MQEREDILRELEDMGSGLGNISSILPYEVPDNYFDQFPDKLMSVITAESMVSKLTPKNPYTVPVGYFEQLPQQILAAAKEQGKSNDKLIALSSNIWKRTRLAAAAVLLLLTGMGIFKYALDEGSFSNKLAGLPDDAVNEYVMQTSNELNVTSNLAQATLPKEITSQEIEQYLNETGWQ